ncbi:MAG: L,D-transpeptidase family protein [Verrucomicrobiae bacterium]|nr:L,D-transpeptidase family protein [Verrucomicrobiae bacterium]
MKPSVKFALLIILVAAVALVAYTLGRRGGVSPGSAIPPKTSAPTPAAATAKAPPAPVVAAELLGKALSLRNDGKLAEARDLLRECLLKTSDPSSVAEVQKALGEINIRLILSLEPAPEKRDYVVQPGDSLKKIAQQFGTTVECIVKANNLRDASVIQPGQRLRVTPTKFAVTVSRKDNTLLVTDDGKFFKLYRVGTGQYSTTPTGSFQIADRIPNPVWWREDGQAIPFGHKDNILGKYWLALNIPRYGIHGTWEPESIGRQSSAGCVRLLNDDIEELFIILPVGTPVQIKD